MLILTLFMKTGRSSPPADDTLGYLVTDVARLMAAGFDARARSLGVTRAQWSLIAALVRAEGASQAQLAELLQVTPISVGRLVDRMCRAGWVERRPEPGDRRAWGVFLTAKAHAIRPALRRLSRLTEAEALAALPATQRRKLLEGLATVRSTLAAGQAGGEGKRRARA